MKRVKLSDRFNSSWKTLRICNFQRDEPQVFSNRFELLCDCKETTLWHNIERSLINELFRHVVSYLSNGVNRLGPASANKSIKPSPYAFKLFCNRECDVNTILGSVSPHDSSKTKMDSW